MVQTSAPAPEDDLITPQPKTRPNAVRDALSRQTKDLRGRAGIKSREYAAQGKEKATDALDGVARIIDDTATRLDDRLGENLGSYAHRAAGAINGFTETLRSKDVEELLEDARAAVKRNPALAIGAAAAIGFVFARLIRSATTKAKTPIATPRRKSPSRPNGTSGSSNAD